MIDTSVFPLRIRRFLNDEAGTSAIEYALIAAGVGLALVPFLPSLGDFYKDTFNRFANAMSGNS